MCLPFFSKYKKKRAVRRAHYIPIQKGKLAEDETGYGKTNS